MAWALACSTRASAVRKPICWGYDAYGQASPQPNLVLKSVDAGNDHSCGVKTSNNVVCWGDSTYGQLDVPPPLDG